MSKQVTITLTDEQSRRINVLRKTTMANEAADTPKTEQEMLYTIIERGLTTVESQRRQYQMKKDVMKIWRKAQQDPDLAVKLGLGTRVTVGSTSEPEDESNID